MANRYEMVIHTCTFEFGQTVIFVWLTIGSIREMHATRARSQTHKYTNSLELLICGQCVYVWSFLLARACVCVVSRWNNRSHTNTLAEARERTITKQIKLLVNNIPSPRTDTFIHACVQLTIKYARALRLWNEHWNCNLYLHTLTHIYHICNPPASVRQCECIIVCFNRYHRAREYHTHTILMCVCVCVCPWTMWMS